MLETTLRRPVRMVLQRASLSLLLGSLDGERRRSAWLVEQARLLSTSEMTIGNASVRLIPAQRSA